MSWEAFFYSPELVYIRTQNPWEMKDKKKDAMKIAFLFPTMSFFRKKIQPFSCSLMMELDGSIMVWCSVYVKRLLWLCKYLSGLFGPHHRVNKKCT